MSEKANLLMKNPSLVFKGKFPVLLKCLRVFIRALNVVLDSSVNNWVDIIMLHLHLISSLLLCISKHLEQSVNKLVSKLLVYVLVCKNYNQLIDKSRKWKFSYVRCNHNFKKRTNKCYNWWRVLREIKMMQNSNKHLWLKKKRKLQSNQTKLSLLLRRQKNNVPMLKNLLTILLKRLNNLKKSILTKLEVSIILHKLWLLSVLDWLFFSGIGLWLMVDRLFMKSLNLEQLVQRKNRITSKCVENSSWRIWWVSLRWFKCMTRIILLIKLCRN